MKKFLVITLSVLLLLTVFTGCASKADDKVIKVGASPSPHAEILEVAKDALKEMGYTLEIVEFSDYVLPNTALNDGELDANYFQHEPYLLNFNEEKGTKLSTAAFIHYEPFGIYPGKTASLEALSEGAKVAVPNDTTNEARALLLLEQEGLITLNPDAGITATKRDITSNPLNLDIVELEAAQIPRSLSDVDIAVINGNYAIQAGLSVTNDSIAFEDKDSLAAKTYSNIIAVRTGEEKTEKTLALVKELMSDKVRDFMVNTYDGGVVASF